MNIDRAIKLRHVEGFLAVAETGSISEAARRAHVSQPALSKTIADLERALGEKLFDRVGRRMVLNALGAVFRRHALTAVSSLEAGVAAVAGDRRGDGISVGVLPTVAGGLFPSVVKEFVRRRPDVGVAVMSGPHRFLLDRLRAGEIDLMIGRMPAAQDMAGLRFEFLYEDPIELVARADHPHLGRSAAGALRANPLILPSRDAIIRESVDGFLHAQGLTELRPSLETVSLSLAGPLLSGSEMLWFISRSVVARELAAGRFAAFDLGAAYMSGALGVTARSASEESEALAFLAQLLKDAAERERRRD